MSVAIFLDVENLLCGYGAAGGSGGISIISKILATLHQNLGDKANVAIRKAYANWHQPGMHELQLELVKRGYAIEPIVTGGGQAIRNLLDIQLAVDATEALFRHEDIKHFIIASGDGGYVSLIRKMREYSKVVWMIGHWGSSATILSSYAHRVIPVGVSPPPGSSQAPVEQQAKLKSGGGQTSSAVTVPDALTARWQTFQKSLVPVTVSTPTEAIARIRTGLKAFMTDTLVERKLKGDGLPVKVIEDLPKLLISGYTLAATGKPNEVALWASVVKGTEAELRHLKKGILVIRLSTPQAPKKPAQEASQPLATPTPMPVPTVGNRAAYLGKACQVLRNIGLPSAKAAAVRIEMSEFSGKLRTAAGPVGAEAFGFAKVSEAAATAAHQMGLRLGRKTGDGQAFHLCSAQFEDAELQWVQPASADRFHEEPRYRRILKAVNPALAVPTGAVLAEILTSEVEEVPLKTPDIQAWLKALEPMGFVERINDSCRFKSGISLKSVLERLREAAEDELTKRLDQADPDLLDRIFATAASPSTPEAVEGLPLSHN